jgi:predicted S18 family serine protease
MLFSVYACAGFRDWDGAMPGEAVSDLIRPRQKGNSAAPASCYIRRMKKILAAALLLMVFASPAFAASRHHHHHHHSHHAHHAA